MIEFFKSVLAGAYDFHGLIDFLGKLIEDAKLNAAANGITNCEFICSPAEKVMADLLKSEVTRGLAFSCISLLIV